MAGLIVDTGVQVAKEVADIIFTEAKKTLKSAAIEHQKKVEDFIVKAKHQISEKRVEVFGLVKNILYKVSALRK